MEIADRKAQPTNEETIQETNNMLGSISHYWHPYNTQQSTNKQTLTHAMQDHHYGHIVKVQILSCNHHLTTIQYMELSSAIVTVFARDKSMVWQTD